jgi:hypothetical protein
MIVADPGAWLADFGGRLISRIAATRQRCPFRTPCWHHVVVVSLADVFEKAVMAFVTEAAKLKALGPQHCIRLLAEAVGGLVVHSVGGQPS